MPNQYNKRAGRIRKIGVLEKSFLLILKRYLDDLEFSKTLERKIVKLRDSGRNREQALGYIIKSEFSLKPEEPIDGYRVDKIAYTERIVNK